MGESPGAVMISHGCGGILSKCLLLLELVPCWASNLPACSNCLCAGGHVVSCTAHVVDMHGFHSFGSNMSTVNTLKFKEGNFVLISAGGDAHDEHVRRGLFSFCSHSNPED